MTTERIADQVKFAYWVPNVSGGLVTSTIEQRTDWNYDYNVKLAQTAENNGFEYALSQVRYEASYGAEFQHESTSFSLALLLATQRLKLIAAVHPGLWQPGVLAKLGATADHLPGGRFAVNVVEREAKETLKEIIAKANRPGFHAAVQQAGSSTSDKRGMWADSTFEDLVQYNDGFRTQLIGTPEQIAERISAYRKRGVDLILGGFLHFQEEIEYFGARVLPLVREIEAAESDSIGAPLQASA